MRIPISKKTRFEVFARFKFTCVYCGATAGKTVLEVDHVIPVSKGGDNTIENLVCSCFDCNRGKSNSLISNADFNFEEKAILEKEKEEQGKAYIKYIKIKHKNKESQINLVTSVFEEYYPDMSVTKRFRGSIYNFIENIGIESTCDAMDYACRKGTITNAEESLKYFCGICWNRIKEQEF
jgi:hypothetical protein